MFSVPSDNQLDALPESYNDPQQITLERPPTIDNYRLTIQNLRNAGHSIRPSMIELMHGARQAATLAQKDLGLRRSHSQLSGCRAADYSYDIFKPQSIPRPKKIDFFQKFLLYSLTVAGLAVVLLSTLVCVVTAISICGISSNGITKKGGLYYLVSRSLGPEFGGSIGAIFALANAMMASLYIVSVAETISDLMVEHEYGFVTDNRINDIRAIGIVICVILMLITFAGPDIEQSFTLFMFSLYYLSFFNWCLGSLIPPNEEQQLRGMTGYSLATISQNLLPAWRGENFISVFAVFFPGMTGLMAGSMFINDLRDPARDVPLGMFTSIAVCSLFNLIAVFISGATMLRDVSGASIPIYNDSTHQWDAFPCAANFTCKYGLMNYFQIAELEAAWGPLIIAGIFAMSLSSTMTNLDNGPQIFQVWDGIIRLKY
ncbi:unnamed protein product [Anisakis simplex]|uniref:Solute carrier family 12 member 2 (inferred by orthology to a human protein) n=1 Tax=Anisakis simplex TaxID=6269 RepID=A0A0M3K3P6_ANISI|nr:unnamed protein product [Anisakis simplex]